MVLSRDKKIEVPTAVPEHSPPPARTTKGVCKSPAGDVAATGQVPALEILDGLEAIVYVAEFDTGELLYVNDYTRSLFGDIVGRRCWEALQAGDRREPCPFCTNDRLVDKDGKPTGPYHWEFCNTVNNRWYDITDRAISWIDGRLVRLEIAFDVTERKAWESRLTHQARHDDLTGLPNRREMQSILIKVNAQAVRSGRPYSVFVFDLDRFKLVNDCYGHDAGDHVLKSLSEIARKALRKGDWIGRWGGEEFICVLPDTGPGGARPIAERLRQAVEGAGVVFENRALNVTASVGVGSFPVDGESPEQLLSNVDGALFEAKRSGRNRVRICKRDGRGILSTAARLDEAIKNDWLKPAFQPIVELGSENVVAEEALARILTPKGQVIEASRFMDAASDLQLAHRIDLKIATEAIRRCTLDIQTGRRLRHFVHVSADLLRHPKLVERLLSEVYAGCQACGDKVGPEKPLVIEITGSDFLRSTANAKKILAPLLEFGLTLAIDSTGNGYSVFNYLADLPVGFVKIEGEFVRRLRSDAKIRSIVEGLRSIAMQLGVTTVAEHIEDRETLAILRDMGVDWGQGYLFGAPDF